MLPIAAARAALLPSAFLALTLLQPLRAATPASLADFTRRASEFHSALRVPAFETNADQIRSDTDRAIADANAAIDRIARQDPAVATFESTFGALDFLTAKAQDTYNRAAFIQVSSPSEAVRHAAEDAVKTFSAWSVGLDYREDLYRALRAEADRHPPVNGEDRRLLDDTLRDYRRAGLELSPAERAKVEALRKQLSSLETDFSTNVVEAKHALTFSRAQLAGVPDDMLDAPGVKTGPDAYTVYANVTPQRVAIMENCTVPATRRQVAIARYNLAKEKNVPLMNQIVALRAEIARRLGYASWDDFRTETKMAKTGAAAEQFVTDLIRGIEPKYQAELAEMNALKAADLHDPAARVDYSDWTFYQKQLVKKKYTVDTDALRVYFPYQRCLAGLFATYSTIFGVTYRQLDAPYVWADGVTLWGVTDTRTGAPLGLFYLDMFPREGKYNHFAEFQIQQGRLEPDGTYLRPVAALLCNFPAPGKDGVSLLKHEDVQTLFHEFGHCMHEILTQVHRGRFAGTSVPGDFVEAPSQMLENWVFDKAVLDTFAADYRDPSKKVPGAILARMKEVRIGTAGVTYRFQLALANLDLKLHGPRAEGAPVDCQAETNRAFDEVFVPLPQHSALIAYFGHLADGYDAGYYGYAWADAIAADMATTFQNAPRGFLDPDVGRRLREEVYSRGNSREISDSIEHFLGRPRSIGPFLKRLGIQETQAPAPASGS